ncbi:MAG: 6-bladed beta-propeller [Gemmatimonadota bacterium]
MALPLLIAAGPAHPASGQEMLRPDLVIGGPAASGAAAFEYVQAVGVTADGTIYVLDAGSADIRVFDAAGRTVRRVGGSGGGPGEFRRPSGMLLSGDTLFVVDDELRRLTWLNAAGTAMATRNVPLSPTRHGMVIRILGRAGQRLYLATGMGCYIGRNAETGRSVSADSSVDRRYRLVAVDLVSGQPTILEDVRADDIHPLYRDGGGCTVIPAPFPAATRWAFLADGRRVSLQRGEPTIRIAPLSTEEVASADAPPPGRILTIEYRGRAVRRDDQEAYAHTVLNPPGMELWDSDIAWRTSALEEMEMPQTIPAADDLRVDAADGVWVRRGTSPADTTATWERFDRRGNRLPAIVLPAELRVERITADAVYGVMRDEYGVHSVVRFRLPG